MPLSELLSALLRRWVRKGLKSIRLITEPIFILRDFLEGVFASPQESTVPSHLVVEGADQVNKLPGVAKFHRNIPYIYLYSCNWRRLALTKITLLG